MSMITTILGSLVALEFFIFFTWKQSRQHLPIQQEFLKWKKKN